MNVGTSPSQKLRPLSFIRVKSGLGGTRRGWRLPASTSAISWMISWPRCSTYLSVSGRSSGKLFQRSSRPTRIGIAAACQ